MQMIILMDRPLANDHPDGLVLKNDHPDGLALKNDHMDGLAFCK